MDHYKVCFETYLESFKAINENPNYKKCSQLEQLFRFKLESLMNWSYHDICTEVCGTENIDSKKILLSNIDFDGMSIQELEINFKAFYTTHFFLSTSAYCKVLETIQAIFTYFFKICCCYECWPDRKLFVFLQSKLFCVYRKKIVNSLAPVLIDSE